MLNKLLFFLGARGMSIIDAIPTSLVNTLFTHNIVSLAHPTSRYKNIPLLFAFHTNIENFIHAGHFFVAALTTVIAIFQRKRLTRDAFLA